MWMHFLKLLEVHFMRLGHKEFYRILRCAV